MKKFNERGMYRETINLFEDQRNNISDAAISQTLKACYKTNDFDRGKRIHQLISSKSRQNTFILTSLIQLYSELY